MAQMALGMKKAALTKVTSFPYPHQRGTFPTPEKRDDALPSSDDVHKL
jgi:hypothetical protein